MVLVDRQTRWSNLSAEKKFFTVLPYASFLMVASTPLQWIGLNTIGQDLAKRWYSPVGSWEFYGGLGIGFAFAITDALAIGVLGLSALKGISKGVRRMIPRKED